MRAILTTVSASISDLRNGATITGDSSDRFLYCRASRFVRNLECGWLASAFGSGACSTGFYVRLRFLACRSAPQKASLPAAKRQPLDILGGARLPTVTGLRLLSGIRKMAEVIPAPFLKIFPLYSWGFRCTSPQAGMEQAVGLGGRQVKSKNPDARQYRH